jgi:hypothetical protein
MDRPRVFIGSSSERLEVARNLQVALEDAVTCEATIWNQNVFTPSEFALESLTKAARAADFAILIAAPDDLTESRGERGASPRDNVILELGLFIGILGVRRVLILCPEVESGVRLPSDLFGLTRLPEYRTRGDGNLLAALNRSVLAAKKVIEEHGPRSTPETDAAIPSVAAVATTRRIPAAVVTTILARYGFDSLLANRHPARFADSNQNRPCIHLRAVWRPGGWEQGVARLKNPAAFLSTVPTAVLDRWHSYYARNGGVGGPQQAGLDATCTFDSFFVAVQDCARSATAEPEASVRSALALLDGGPCLRFVADVSLSVPVGPLPASGVLGSLADLARHAMRAMPSWLADEYGEAVPTSGVLELHAQGRGALQRDALRDSLESYVDLEVLGTRSRAAQASLMWAGEVDALNDGAPSFAVADAIASTVINWGFLSAPDDIRERLLQLVTSTDST